MELENERDWLRHRVIRMRTSLRFAMNPEVTEILRELIADAEARLSMLEAQANERRPIPTARPQAGDEILIVVATPPL